MNALAHRFPAEQGQADVVQSPGPATLGKSIHKATALMANAVRSLVLVNWYRLCWSFGRGCKIAGRIRRRSFSGDAVFGQKCELGHNLVIDVGGKGMLVVGHRVSINAGTFISVLGKVEIGDDTRIGEYCSIRDNDHEYRDPSVVIQLQGMVVAGVSIGRDAWLGRNVTVQKGVKIGNGAVVGANAFVNRDIPDFAIAVGSPARIIGRRGSE